MNKHIEIDLYSCERECSEVSVDNPKIIDFGNGCVGYLETETDSFVAISRNLGNQDSSYQGAFLRERTFCNVSPVSIARLMRCIIPLKVYQAQNGITIQGIEA